MASLPGTPSTETKPTYLDQTLSAYLGFDGKESGDAGAGAGSGAGAGAGIAPEEKPDASKNQVVIQFYALSAIPGSSVTTPSDFGLGDIYPFNSASAELLGDKLLPFGKPSQTNSTSQMRRINSKQDVAAFIDYKYRLDKGSYEKFGFKSQKEWATYLMITQLAGTFIAASRRNGKSAENIEVIVDFNNLKLILSKAAPEDDTDDTEVASIIKTAQGIARDSGATPNVTVVGAKAPMIPALHGAPNLFETGTLPKEKDFYTLGAQVVSETLTSGSPGFAHGKFKLASITSGKTSSRGLCALLNYITAIYNPDVANNFITEALGLLKVAREKMGLSAFEPTDGDAKHMVLAKAITSLKDSATASATATEEAIAEALTAAAADKVTYLEKSAVRNRGPKIKNCDQTEMLKAVMGTDSQELTLIELIRKFPTCGAKLAHIILTLHFQNFAAENDADVEKDASSSTSSSRSEEDRGDEAGDGEAVHMDAADSDAAAPAPATAEDATSEATTGGGTNAEPPKPADAAAPAPATAEDATETTDAGTNAEPPKPTAAAAPATAGATSPSLGDREPGAIARDLADALNAQRAKVDAQASGTARLSAASEEIDEAAEEDEEKTSADGKPPSSATASSPRSAHVVLTNTGGATSTGAGSDADSGTAKPTS